MYFDKIKFFLLSRFFTAQQRKQISEAENSELQRILVFFAYCCCKHFTTYSEFTAHTIADWVCYYPSNFQILTHKAIHADLQLPMSNTLSYAKIGLHLLKHPTNELVMTLVHSKPCSRFSGPPEEKFFL